MSLPGALEGAIAAHRFGLGARPGEIAKASSSPKSWAMRQLDSPPPQPKSLDGTSLKSGGELVLDLYAYGATVKASKEDPVKNFIATRVPILVNELAARFALGFTTEKPFAERLVWFWSNHFTVSAQNPRALTFCGAFEREAIRSNISGKFEDLLLAVVRHPAMLLYLDNAQSIGPGSLAGRIVDKGLNENLGRELLELHTLGVDGGYTQDDVVALAKLLTGWSIDKDGGTTGFKYYPARHEPGKFSLRGKEYSGGEEGCIAALKDLARDPATARHIAKKFAAHFIADNPSPQSIAALEKNFLQTGGDLKALAEAALDDPDAWKPASGKMRTPVEYVTAAMRLLAWPHGNDLDKQVKGVIAAARLMGEVPLGAPSPKGWPDNAGAWSGPDALLNRIEWAREVGNRIPNGIDIAAVADMTLGPLLQDKTRAAIRTSSTAGEAVALLLSSPEFQRR